MWNLPGPGIEPVSPALAGELLTTGQPGKSTNFLKYNLSFNQADTHKSSNVEKSNSSFLYTKLHVPVQNTYTKPVKSGRAWLDTHNVARSLRPQAAPRLTSPPVSDRTPEVLAPRWPGEGMWTVSHSTAFLCRIGYLHLKPALQPAKLISKFYFNQ